jgi:hypothetical protein
MDIRNSSKQMCPRQGMRAEPQIQMAEPYLIPPRVKLFPEVLNYVSNSSMVFFPKITPVNHKSNVGFSGNVIKELDPD